MRAVETDASSFNRNFRLHLKAETYVPQINEHKWLSQFLDVTFSRPSLNDNESFALTLTRFDAVRLKAMRGKNGSNN